MKSITEMTYLEIEKEILSLERLQEKHGEDKYRNLPLSHFNRIEKLAQEKLRRLKAELAEEKKREKARNAKLKALHENEAKLKALGIERRALNLEKPEDRKRLSQILQAEKFLHTQFKKLQGS